MNKILLVLNIVLLLAVGFLYYLYIQYTRDDIHTKKYVSSQLANSFKVAYFDIDTLENYYDYSKMVRKDLMQKDSANQSLLSKMVEGMNTELKQYIQPGVPPNQMQQSNYLQKKSELQTEYDEKSNSLGQQLQTESFQRIQHVKETIQNFLKQYCKDKGYAYVLSTQEYDNIVYYKDTIRNITMDLVQKLNEKFRKEQNR